MTRKQTETTCLDLDDFGRGVARIDGLTCFVDDFLPGEKAIVETTFEYGKLSDARIVRRLSDSPFRVKPACPYYPACGGCQIAHLSYEKQLEYKQKKVKDLLHKFAHLDCEVEPTRGLASPIRFRNKVQKPVRMDYRHNLPVAGFFANGSHDLIAVSDCLMETELSNRITAAILDLMVKYDYRPYDEDEMRGDIRHILIKTSDAYPEALVTLVVADPDLPGRLDFAKELCQRFKEIRGVVFNVNRRHTSVVLGEEDIPVYGHSRIADKIFGKDFLISSKSFYQTNSKQIEVLYGIAIDVAGLKKTDTVLDAYCGTGTIGLSLADKVKKVIGVEIVSDAVHDAITNAKINKITNARFIRGDATEYLESTKDAFDVIMMDPPRKGSTPEFLKAVERIAPRTLVYVSCDPVTLARDIGLIKDRYEVTRVIPVDMFPNTMHVETVCELSLRNADKH